MALIPKISFKQNDPKNLVVEISDITGSYATNNEGGYGSPNLTYANAYARYRIGNYADLTSLSDVSVGNLLARTEYIKTKGSANTYEGVSIGIGDVYVPTVNTAVISGDTFTQTGFYVPLILSSRYQPNASIPLYLNSGELGLGADAEIEDTIFEIEYQVYGAILTNPTSVSGTTYLVQSNNTTYNGNTYKIGNVFTAVGASSIVGTVSPFVANYFNVFQSSYNVKYQLKDIVVSNIENPKPKQSTFQAIIANLYASINCIEMIDGLGNVSTEQSYENLQNIAFICNNIKNNNY
jgi:hypothetical protein